MDLATHALAGFVLSRARRDWAERPAVAVVLVGAALLPDVDLIAAILDPDHAALHRHTLTHALPLLPPIAFAFAIVVRAAGVDLRLGEAFGLALLGLASHVGLDLVNAYGVALLYPFSQERFELPLLFVVDPVLTAALAIPAAISLWLARTPSARVLAARTAIALALLHLALAAGLRDTAEAALARVAEGRPALLVPEPLAPWRWRGIVPVADGYRQVLVAPAAGTVAALPDVPSAARDPRVEAVRRSGILRAAEPFLRAPVWTVSDDRVSVHDLRYRFATLGNGWDPFGFAVVVSDGDVQPVGATLGERIERSLDTLGEVWRGSPRAGAGG
ncbi:MAG: metal-dependent hydrolase [Alphaproteobacteria bacterium]